ncbi:hypothetical protein DH2020_023563 [Rehmannia glutinosa]|uniref:Reticulon domain-containing protein n=1 Tax=Rehmannia glutinosa TaxID=99300 RepID=A0ABR0WAK2_REHGL
MIDKITEKFHGSDSSSTDSDDDNDIKLSAAAVKAKIYRLFGRERPVAMENLLIFSYGGTRKFLLVCLVLQLQIGLRHPSRCCIRERSKEIPCNHCRPVGSFRGKLLQLPDLILHLFCFVLLLSVPMLYEKYEDQIDSFAEKAEAELKKKYVVFNAKVLSKIPKGPFKDKKFL